MTIPKGRLNDVNEGVFYGAISIIGTLIELRPELNRFFTISTIRKNSKPDPMFYVAGDMPFFAGLYSPNPSEKLVRTYLDTELSKVASTSNEYNSTIAIARMLLQKEINPGEIITGTNFGLAYPSVESKKIASDTTYNVAFLPKIYDAHYLISEVVVYVLISKPANYELYDVNKGHIANGGKIEWLFNFSTMRDRISKGTTATNRHAPEIVGLETLL